MAGSPDPTEIRSVAVTAEDLVAAVETALTSDRDVVLRVTPPFSGRMRARLHVRRGEDDPGLPIPPERFLADVPPYPRPPETEDDLRADPDRRYTVERHREYHERAVAAWRRAVRHSVRDRVTLETESGAHEVTVNVLG